MKFINRESELVFIGKEFEAPHSSFIVIYGKRRIGKTALIRQSANGKSLLYFLGRQVNNKDNLEQISQTCALYFNEQLLMDQPFRNWDQFFLYLSTHLTRNTLVVFDEYPYFVSAQQGLSSIFQKWWDESLQHIPQCKLIICGSSFGMMIDEVLSEKSPLYGRRTGQIHVQPMSYYDSWKFFSKQSFTQFLEYYSVTGGNPEYLTRFSKHRTIQDAIQKELMDVYSPMYDEINFLLKEELREPKNYYSILKSLAIKRNKISDLIEQTGIEKSSLHTYLYYLENLGLIEKEVPITEKHPEKSRKGLYKIKDQFVQFWFRFVLPYQREIEIGERKFLNAKIKELLPTVIQDNYQSIAPEVLHNYKDRIGTMERIGRYWKNQIEIDHIGLHEQDHTIFFIESKWSDKEVGINILEALKEKAESVDWHMRDRKEKYILLSKTGFTDALIQAKNTQHNIFLIEKDTLL